MNTIADANGDIAALVYASTDRPDLVLCAFAQRLNHAGYRVSVLVQLRERQSGGPGGRVLVLDSWQFLDVARKPAGVSQCRLDSDWLDRMGDQARAAVRKGIDTVIVNRFGPLEESG